MSISSIQRTLITRFHRLRQSRQSSTVSSLLLTSITRPATTRYACCVFEGRKKGGTDISLSSCSPFFSFFFFFSNLPPPSPHHRLSPKSSFLFPSCPPSLPPPSSPRNSPHPTFFQNSSEAVDPVTMHHQSLMLSLCSSPCPLSLFPLSLSLYTNGVLRAEPFLRFRLRFHLPS